MEGQCGPGPAVPEEALGILEQVGRDPHKNQGLQDCLVWDVVKCSLYFQGCQADDVVMSLGVLQCRCQVSDGIGSGVMVAETGETWMFR